MRIKHNKLYTRGAYKFRVLGTTQNYVYLHGLENDVRFYVTKQQFEELYSYYKS